MWMVNNETPFSAACNWVLDKDAAKSWVIAVKATFDILPDGSTRLADQQGEPLYGEIYAGEAGKTSIVYDGDLGGAKQRTDVVLNGFACAPAGRPVTEIMVTMRVGGHVKTLQVFGDRLWHRGVVGLALTRPAPFTTMPIVYERAFGGWDRVPQNPADQRLEPRNPIGAGFATREEHLLNTLAPNIEDPRQLISSWKDRPQPAGFGVVASYWMPRLKYGGTYDAAWQKQRFPLLAADFDPRFYQCAPEDQQITLRGGERVELINLTPDGRLAFELPKRWLGFETRFGERRVDHRANLHTVILEPAIPRVVMVWHTTLPVANRDVDYLDETIVFEKDALGEEVAVDE
jgi:hypothetical protein